jgi:hypothetical protein
MLLDKVEIPQGQWTVVDLIGQGGHFPHRAFPEGGQNRAR